MARVYKTTEKIKVQIEDVTFYLSPLTYGQKKDCLNAVIREGGAIRIDKMEVCRRSVKYSVKSVEGLEVEQDGKTVPYELKFEEDGTLSDESVDDLFNVPSVNAKLIMVASYNTGDGLSTNMTDENNKPLEGVEVFLNKKARKRK